MGFEFTPNEWLIVGLALLFGLLLGAAMAAGGGRKYRDRAREEQARADELARENQRLEKELREFHSLRGAAARDGAPVVERRRGLI